MAVPVIANVASNTKDFIGDNWLKLLIASGVIVGGYAVYKQFFAGDKQDFDKGEPPPNIDMTTARTKAEQLFNAMRSPGTDEEIIYDILNGMNFNDFVMISNEFGKRYYDKTLGTDGGWLFNDELSLHEWLLEELSNSELAELETYMPDVLLRNNDSQLAESEAMNKPIIATNDLSYAL